MHQLQKSFSTAAPIEYYDDYNSYGQGYGYDDYSSYTGGYEDFSTEYSSHPITPQAPHPRRGRGGHHAPAPVGKFFYLQKTHIANYLSSSMDRQRNSRLALVVRTEVGRLWDNVAGAIVAPLGDQTAVGADHSSDPQRMEVGEEEETFNPGCEVWLPQNVRALLIWEVV